MIVIDTSPCICRLSASARTHPRMSTALVKGKLKVAREAIQVKDYGKAEKAARCAKADDDAGRWCRCIDIVEEDMF